jgi:hypothetical protein
MTNGFDRSLYADLSEYTTTAVERLPGRREYFLLQATFLAAKISSTANAHRMRNADTRLSMKPRIGVYLSEQMAARLTAAARRPGASKSALVEAALAQYLGDDDDINDLPVDRRLALMSRQLEELDRGLRIVNETVALQARFHLAMTPVLPAADQRAACVLGSERFDELAAQVSRRVQLRSSLMQETMDRLSTAKRDTATIALGGGAPQACSLVQKPDLPALGLVGDQEKSFAAVREGGSMFNFPGKAGIPLQ